MAELDDITATLRRQRRDLEDLMDTTLSRSSETAELLQQVEDLRRRVEDTQRRVAAAEANTPRPETSTRADRPADGSG